MRERRRVVATERKIHDESDRLMAVVSTAIVMWHEDYGVHLTGQDISTALTSLLLNLLVSQLRIANDEEDRVRDGMRKLAARLVTLAETRSENIESVAQFLADEPYKPLSRQ
jgi:hypothetical protein